MNRALGALGVAIAFVALIMFGGLSAIIIGWPNLAKANNAVLPKVTELPYENIRYATRVNISGTDYAVWDVRDNRTNLIKFMILTDNDGNPVRDSKLQAEAFSIRLALQSAYVIVAIHNGATQAGQFASTIAALGRTASVAADTLGEASIARQINALTGSLSDSSANLAALALILDNATPYATQLIDNPSDKNADLFMTSLGATAVLNYSNQAALIYLILVNASQNTGISLGPWLQSIYGLITQGTYPSLSLMSVTFGEYESSLSSNELEMHIVS